METKRLVMISKCGPAFSVEDVQQAHAQLDLAGAPRTIEGSVMTLAERIAWLRGRFNLGVQS